jgi:hypothetical protein
LLQRTAAAKSRFPCGHLIAALKALRHPKAFANALSSRANEDPYNHRTAESLRGAPTSAAWPAQSPHTKNVSLGIQERKIRKDPWQNRSRSYRRTAAGNISSTSTMLVG